MNNLHRELAPISADAWDQIDDEARRTLRRYLAARKVVDLAGPKGIGFSSVGTGHVRPVQSPVDGVGAVQREVRPLVEFRAVFTLSRQAVDDVERGALDSDWQPVKDAARQIAFAEDRAVFDGFAGAGIEGVRAAASNPAMALPAKLDDWPEAVEAAVNQLRLVGVDGPYVLVLSEKAYTDAKGGAENGYPLLRHIREAVDEVVWAPAIEGGFVVSKRGGDFELTVGQDFSVGYLGHSATTIDLYLQESMTFRVLTTEAAVPLSGA